MAADKTFDEYQAIALAAVERFEGSPLQHLIGGCVPAASVSGQTFENHSPVDSSLLGLVASGNAADVDAAARAADDAFADWSGRTGKERKKILHRVADLIEGSSGRHRSSRMCRHRPDHSLHVGCRHSRG